MLGGVLGGMAEDPKNAKCLGRRSLWVSGWVGSLGVRPVGLFGV